MGLPVAFRFQEVTETGVEMGGEFGFQGVEGMHGSFQFFGPGGMRRSRPTLADGIKIFGQGGVKAGFSRGEGHTGKIEKG